MTKLPTLTIDIRHGREVCKLHMENELFCDYLFARLCFHRFFLQRYIFEDYRRGVFKNNVQYISIDIYAAIKIL